MSNYSIQSQNLSKLFGRRLIFKDINFNWMENGIFGISGPNGSGKSTLVKIVAGLISASSGKLIHKNSIGEIIPEQIHNHIGFVSPYLVLYEEFSAWENLKIFSQIRGVPFNEERILFYLKQFLLDSRKNDLVKTYSSGMKQRLKFIFALMHSPEVLIFDEPTSNLDEEGKKVVYDIVREEGKSRIVVIASNEERDLELCHEKILLENFKTIERR
ncbi:MAG: ABC transporter ATP-binding protein [Ignavibacteriota bacterium]|jgi:heme exporter protein A|nr:MAG: ABC transporter ATP-binding protein [Chlorobiota bacterium]MBE7476695.1 ABC transporter ATP-binding protein [Ignavibacteriales bacterium]MBL1122053.1 ABC transporter ATP-binding protein [Ignavibacteriota bacterium]MCC7094675.1 ABC transporter ATP-binding protein [Ignavibacteriaceae bacterium]MCE7856093.1 ABC transporter ATP-binding protein [Ignavibacteria bacterium CHB3]MEB2296746.1 ABC transporter ATP-binding protein [Ignavibacteria bacterium]